MFSFEFFHQLDPGRLAILRSVALDFCITFLIFSFVGAILLQATHELLRSAINKGILRYWLWLELGAAQQPNARQRSAINRGILRYWLLTLRREASVVRDASVVDVLKICEESGVSSSSLLSLPYWQLTGQLNAVTSSELNLYPSSRLVSTFAKLTTGYQNEIKDKLEARGVTPENRKAAELRDVAARVQTGINSLHAQFRVCWTIFDYGAALVIAILIVGLMTTLPQTQGQRFVLYSIGIFSWLAMPIIRRMIEILVPFR